MYKKKIAARRGPIIASSLERWQTGISGLFPIISDLQGIWPLKRKPFPLHLGNCAPPRCTKGLVVLSHSKATLASSFPASSALALAVDWLRQERAVLQAAVTRVSGARPVPEGTLLDVHGEVCPLTVGGTSSLEGLWPMMSDPQRKN